MKLLITREIPQAGINLLKKYKDIEIDYRQGPPLSDKDLKEAISSVDAIIPVIPDRITDEVINAGKNLKVIATYSVGYDHIDIPTATKKKIYVANTPGDLTLAVAEHCAALMFDIARRTSEADRFCREGDYKYWDPLAFIGPKLTGKTLGIIGFGRIGQKLARISKYGFDMNILYSDPMDHSSEADFVNAKKVNLDELLEKSDFVSLNCNLSEETFHLIGDQQFAKMKPTAYLINTSRGPVVNEPCLVRALKEGIIAGAALDVFENEPTIHKELLNMENVVLTPHIASATWEARIEMATMAVDNVIDVLINNKPPRNLVNKELLEDKVSSLV